MIYARILMTGMILLNLLGAAPVSLAQDDQVAAVTKVEPSIVAVYVYDREEKILAQGNGFFITKEGHLVTRRSLLEGANHVDVKTKDGMLYPVINVLAEDKEANLIRVSVDISGRNVEPACLNTVLPQPGERVFTVSSPWVTNKPTITGTVSALLQVPAFGRMIQLFIHFPASSDGSPVLNREGQVIGIAVLVDAQDFAIVPAERIAKMVPTNAKPLTAWDGDKKRSAEKRYAAGLSSLRKGDYAKALSLFEQAAAADPQYANAYFQIGFCHSQLTQPGQAVEAYKEALRINPDFVLAHFYLGLAYLDLRDRAGAQREYEALKNLDPDYARDLFGLM